MINCAVCGQPRLEVVSIPFSQGPFLWPICMECIERLNRDAAENEERDILHEFESIQNGDAAPEEVEALRRQIRVLKHTGESQ